MSILVVCLACWLAGACILLSLIFCLRMRKKMAEWESTVPVPRWAIVALFGLALAWPILILAAIVDRLFGERIWRHG